MSATALAEKTQFEKHFGLKNRDKHKNYICRNLAKEIVSTL